MSRSAADRCCCSWRAARCRRSRCSIDDVTFGLLSRRRRRRLTGVPLDASGSVAQRSTSTLSVPESAIVRVVAATSAACRWTRSPSRRRDRHHVASSRLFGAVGSPVGVGGWRRLPTVAQLVFTPIEHPRPVPDLLRRPACATHPGSGLSPTRAAQAASRLRRRGLPDGARPRSDAERRGDELVAEASTAHDVQRSGRRRRSRSPAPARSADRRRSPRRYNKGGFRDQAGSARLTFSHSDSVRSS